MNGIGTFEKEYDFGILGKQEAEVEYTADGYKPLYFYVWLHDFDGKCLEVTEYLTDAAKEEIYADCANHAYQKINEFLEYRAWQEEQYIENMMLHGVDS